MLFILIPIAWLAVVTLVVAVCQTAARADTRLAAAAGDHPTGGASARDATAVFEAAVFESERDLSLKDRRPICRWPICR